MSSKVTFGKPSLPKQGKQVWHELTVLAVFLLCLRVPDSIHSFKGNMAETIVFFYHQMWWLLILCMILKPANPNPTNCCHFFSFREQDLHPIHAVGQMPGSPRQTGSQSFSSCQGQLSRYHPLILRRQRGPGLLRALAGPSLDSK